MHDIKSSGVVHARQRVVEPCRFLILLRIESLNAATKTSSSCLSPLPGSSKLRMTPPFKIVCYFLLYLWIKLRSRWLRHCPPPLASCRFLHFPMIKASLVAAKASPPRLFPLDASSSSCGSKVQVRRLRPRLPTYRHSPPPVSLKLRMASPFKIFRFPLLAAHCFLLYL